MRFHERHPGLLQIEGDTAIAARLHRALQRNEVRRKLHVIGRRGWKQSQSAASHGIVLIPTARGALAVRVFVQQRQ